MGRPSVNSEQPRIHVFVYGTLKPGERYHEQYCGAHLVQAEVAIATGNLYDFPQLGYPAMTMGQDWVQGYRLSFNHHDVLTVLDTLEDYSSQRPPTENEYQRQEIDIFTPQQHPFSKAWAYFMDPARVKQLGGVYLPDGVWKGQPHPLSGWG